MNRYLLFLLLLAYSWTSTANMASPNIYGTFHSSLIFPQKCTVTQEKIRADIIKNSDKDFYYEYIIRLKVTYHITSPTKQEMPLLFMASNYLNDQQIYVNGQAIPSSPIDKEQDYPFLIKEEITDTLQYTNAPTRYHAYTKYYISYDGKEKQEVEPSNLIYFTAPLKAGENMIEVSYGAFPSTRRYGFLPPYTFEYSIYPSKFWKTFPEIDIEIHFPKELKFEQSSMEAEEYTVSDHLFQGKIKDFHSTPEHYWRFSPKPSWLGSVVLAIGPLGFGIILFLGAVGLHLYCIKKKKNGAYGSEYS